MARPSLEVADIFRRHGDRYRLETGALSLAQRRVMTAIERCRTAALGSHVEQCDRCRHTRVWCNSCRNRHCPECQSLARAEWIEQREAEILDCPYFYVVFTVPELIATIAYANKAVGYGILFRAAAETLRTIAGDPKHLGAEIGFFAVLYTWGQQLQHHPLFRRLFLHSLQQAFDAGRLRLTGSLEPLADPATFAPHLARARATECVVSAKRPFAGPASGCRNEDRVAASRR